MSMPCCYKALYREGKKERFMSASSEQAAKIALEDLPVNSTVWVYQLTNSDGLDAGDKLVFEATRYA